MLRRIIEAPGHGVRLDNRIGLWVALPAPDPTPPRPAGGGYEVVDAEVVRER